MRKWAPSLLAFWICRCGGISATPDHGGAGASPDAGTNPDSSTKRDLPLEAPCTGELSEVGATCPATFDGTIGQLPVCLPGNDQYVSGCNDLVEFSWGGGYGSSECIYSASSHALVGARQNGDYPGFCVDGSSGSNTWTAGRTPAGPCTSSFGFHRACENPDAGAGEAAVDVATDCAKLQQDWAAFVLTHRDCSVDTDCIFLGGPDSFNQCSSASIGSAGRDPIASTATADAWRMFLNVFYGSACAPYRLAHATADQGPSKNLRCQDGTCTADLQFCNAQPPSDAGAR